MARILVTGGAGFIGSHLSEALIARGDDVIVVDDLSTGQTNNLEKLNASPNFHFIQASIQDPEVVKKLVADVDQVYHLAAAVGVALIAKEPIQTIERNIAPTSSIFSALEERHLKGESIKIFMASTSEVYGKNPKDKWNEDDDLVFGSTTRARWSYGASKAIDEFLALGYWRQSQLPCVIGRFFNVVGPRQTGAYGMVLPRFVDAALAGKSLQVHDDGKQVRCFADVADVVECVIGLMEQDAASGRVFNIGADQPVSILELANRVIAITESSSKVEFMSYADAYDEDFEDIRRRVPDLTRLKSTLGFAPKNDLDGIIRKLAAERS